MYDLAKFFLSGTVSTTNMICPCTYNCFLDGVVVPEMFFSHEVAPVSPPGFLKLAFLIKKNILHILPFFHFHSTLFHDPCHLVFFLNMI